MSEVMRPLPFDTLLTWILDEYNTHRSIFAVPEALFYRPRPDDPFSSELFGHHLATPIGPAAGPHTQLAQNIVSAWLSGGRFIELKTVQIMDTLDIPRPCIDAADEGYNVEWSQELRLAESVLEYVKAWALVHVLRRVLGFEDAPFGTIFNMSVGYNLEGILSPPMQAFMDQLEHAAEPLATLRATLHRRPEFKDVSIPDRIVDSVTLSTMHGCPPDEIERIARYLIEERGLHTTVKLNPTLLGKRVVLDTLHGTLGYTGIEIPGDVFAHDLAYDRALALIRSLQASADARGVTFSVKLSNTLAMANHRGVLPGEEMYMSGRALFPVTTQLFQRLRADIGPGLRVSYSAGADALNLPGLLATGARPVTVASDLLKPGGYGRFAQYLSHLRETMVSADAATLATWSSDPERALSSLVEDAQTSVRYKRSYHIADLPKVASELGRFDCIEAPCVAQCAVAQDVPEYAYWIRQGDLDRALSAILHRNPLPGCTGYVCTNLCQTRCTRHNYDDPVAIRRLKRFATERGNVPLTPAPATGKRVAVIGGGPSGLAAAFYLALSGVAVTVFEARDRAGGMLAIAPSFRLPTEVVDADLARIRALGVDIRCNARVEESPETLLDSGYSAVYLACGFADDARLPLEGGDAGGVCGALELLNRVAHGDAPSLGDRVVVIGGGNTAMDAARTARRLTGVPATVAYRRTRAEMPAEEEEIHDLILEGNRLEELAIPLRILSEDGRVTGVECVRAELGPPDEDGRRRPVPVPNSTFVLPATAVVEAVGQRPDTAFLKGSTLTVRAEDGGIDVGDDGRTALDGVYAGGDIARGPAIIIAACADGRTAAADICRRLKIPFRTPPRPALTLDDVDRGQLKAERARQMSPQEPSFLDPTRRGSFDLVEATFTADQAKSEAARCLQCQLLCDKCVDVCPNRANVPIRVAPIVVTLPQFNRHSGGWEEDAPEMIEIRQSQQILHVDDLCNECGNCATFCIHDGKPYLEKPRLFLDRTAFDAETDNAFWIDNDGLACRQAGRTARWTNLPGGGVYEFAGARFVFDENLSLREYTLEDAETDFISLRPAVEAAVLWRAIRSDARYLPQSGSLRKDDS